MEHDLSLAGHPEVFVVGDAAAVPWGPAVGPTPARSWRRWPSSPGGTPRQQILPAAGGSAHPAVPYQDKGMMATIGRRAAVAELPDGFILRGTLGWLAWLGLHIVYLIGFRNRLIVLLNWWWRYVDWPSGPRLIEADVDTEP